MLAIVVISAKYILPDDLISQNNAVIINNHVISDVTNCGGTCP